jgi:hypothetical protein
LRGSLWPPRSAADTISLLFDAEGRSNGSFHRGSVC